MNEEEIKESLFEQKSIGRAAASINNIRPPRSLYLQAIRVYGKMYYRK